MCNRSAFYKNWNHHHASKFRHQGGHSGKKLWKEKFFRAAFSTPPVNVKELDDKYVLYLYAPGFEKSDFLIAIVDSTLSISLEKKEEEKTTWRRQEYALDSFKRQFELNDKVDKTDISAKYERGILKVTLPKLEGFETARQKVEVA